MLRTFSSRLLRKTLNSQNHAYATLASPVPFPPSYAGGVKVGENAALEQLIYQDLTKKAPRTAEEQALKKFSSKIEAAGDKKNSQKVLRAFESMRIEGVKPNYNIYTIAVNALVRCKEMTLAQQYLDQMRKDGFEPPIGLKKLVVGYLKRTGDTAAAQTLLDEILQDFQKQNKIPDIFTFNKALKVFTRAGDEAGANKTLEKMTQAGVSPDKFTYSTLLGLYGTKGQEDIQKALKLVEEMREKNIEVDRTIYNQLIRCCPVANVNTAVEIFNSMETYNVPRDERTYYNLIRKFVHAKDYARAFEYFDRLLKVGLKASSNLVYIMFEASVADNNNMLQARKIWRHVVHQLPELKTTFESTLTKIKQGYKEIRVARNKQFKESTKAARQAEAIAQAKIAQESESEAAAKAQEAKEKKEKSRLAVQEARRQIALKAKKAKGIVELDQKEADDALSADAEVDDDAASKSRAEKKKARKENQKSTKESNKEKSAKI